MTITRLRLISRENCRYITVPHWSLFKPLLFMWTAWLILSFLPGIIYISIMTPILLLCSLVIWEWYRVWQCYGYNLRAYIGLNMLVLIIARIIGLIFQNDLLYKLIEWKIIVSF